MNPWTKLSLGPKDPTQDLAQDPAQMASFVTQQTGGVGMTDPMREVAQNAHAISQMANPYGAPLSAAPGDYETPSEERHFNTMDTRDLLGNLINSQSGGIENLQAAAEKIKALAHAREGQANLSPLLALNDSLNGGNLAKNYVSPEEEGINALKAEQEVQKARQPLTQDVAKQLQTETSGENGYLRAVASKLSEKPTGLLDEKGQPIVLDKDQRKAAADFNNIVMLGGRGAPAEVRRSIGKLQSAMQYQNLVAAIPNGEPNAQEMSDLTSALAGLVSNQSATTDHKFTTLYPKSMALDANSIIQWFTSEPHGVNQREWLKRWGNEVNAEKQGAYRTVNSWIDAKEKQFSGILLPAAYAKHSANQAREFFKQGYEAMKPADFAHGDAAAGKSGMQASGEVARATKDGKTAIFDAATKKFLRYQ